MSALRNRPQASRPPRLQTNEQWQELALCAQVDAETFFPDKANAARAREAKKVCSACEVRVQCLEYALANHERYGIWGGLSERERRRLRHKGAPKSIDHQAFRSRAL